MVVNDANNDASVAHLFNYSQVTPIWAKQNTDLQGIITLFDPKPFRIADQYFKMNFDLNRKVRKVSN